MNNTNDIVHSRESPNQQQQPSSASDHQLELIDSSSATTPAVSELEEANEDNNREREEESLEMEADQWVSTIKNKQLLSEMEDCDIQRQEIIYELIQTEKHHCSTLEIMKKIYSDGIKHHMKLTPTPTSTTSAPQTTAISSTTTFATTTVPLVINNQTTSTTTSDNTTTTTTTDTTSIDVARLFPCLDDLISVHETFLQQLRERYRLARSQQSSHSRSLLMSKCQNHSHHHTQTTPTTYGVIRQIGDILLRQFSLQLPSSSSSSSSSSANCDQQQPDTTMANTSHQLRAACNANEERKNVYCGCTCSGTSTTTTTTTTYEHQQAPGTKLRLLYGQFCGQHYDAIQYYKRLMKSDKRFQRFIEVSLSVEFSRAV